VGKPGLDHEEEVERLLGVVHEFVVALDGGLLPGEGSDSCESAQRLDELRTTRSGYCSTSEFHIE
jgi:hypothetical protein